MRDAVAIAAILCFLACASSKPGWRSDPDSSALVYAPLGISFPSRFEDLERLAPENYDQDGNNVSIGYSSSKRDLELTFYIYPRTFGGLPEPEEHFKSAIGAVLHVDPKARVDRGVARPLPLGAADLPGYLAFIHWSEPARDAGSFLLLIPRGDRFFKLRVTFELDGSAEPMQHAWSQTQRFLRSIEVRQP